MTRTEARLVQSLLDAYRVLREAYHHDMHREAPAKTDLEIQIAKLLARQPQNTHLPMNTTGPYRDGAKQMHRLTSQTG